MSEHHSNKWKTGFWIVFIVAVFFLAVIEVNYNHDQKTISSLKAQIQTSSSTSPISSPDSSNNTINQPPAQSTANKQSWLCSQSIDTSIGDGINALCTPSTVGADDLSCSGTLNKDLTTQNYPYAQLDMTCSTSPY